MSKNYLEKRRDGKYQVITVHPDGRQTWDLFRSKTEAQQAIEDVERRELEVSEIK